jgi:hypothetical protein
MVVLLLVLVLAGAEGVLGHGRAGPVRLRERDRGRDVGQVRQPLGIVAQQPPAVAVVFLGNRPRSLPQDDTRSNSSRASWMRPW